MAMSRRQGAWLAFYSWRQVEELRDEILAAPSFGEKAQAGNRFGADSLA